MLSWWCMQLGIQHDHVWQVQMIHTKWLPTSNIMMLTLAGCSSFDLFDVVQGQPTA
jgi:hypothetical protein